MFKLEKQQVNPFGRGRSRWEDAGPARYATEDEAQSALERRLEDEMDRAIREERSTPLPRFRVVRALQVVACMVLQ